MSQSKEQKLQQLHALASSVEIEPDHWIGNYPSGDNGMQYCRECCEKNIEVLKSGFHPPDVGDDMDNLKPLNAQELQDIKDAPPFVDGGSCSHYDEVPVCKRCDKPLAGLLTDTAINDEFRQYLEKNDNNEITSAKMAWALMEVVYAVDTFDPRVDKLINSVSISDQLG